MTAVFRGTQFRTIEVRNERSRRAEIKEKDVTCEDLGDWLKDPETENYNLRNSLQKPILRLICCDIASQIQLREKEIDAVGQICKAWNLHRTTHEAFTSNNGVFVRFLTKDALSGSIKAMHIVIKVPHFVVGAEGLSLYFDVRQRTTLALLHGYTDTTYRSLLSYLTSYLPSSITPVTHPFAHPLILPTHLLRIYRHSTESYRAKVDRSIFSTEQSLGYAVPGSLLHESPNKGPGKLDFERFVWRLHDSHDEYMRRLHSCQTELGALGHVGRFGKALGGWLEEVMAEVEGVTTWVADPDGGNRNEDAEAHLRVHEGLLHEIGFQTSLWWAAGEQMAVLKERTQTHINLIFSVIAQDENRLSRSVAQKSEMIASATKKDSAAMKTLAVLTTVFLPPTFVATFFSMTMFDWTSDSTDAVVTSKYLWVYWAVAVPLTILVLVAWRVWWRVEDRRYREDLGKNR